MTDRPATDTRTGGPAAVGTKPGDLQPADVRHSDLAIGIDFGGSGIKGAVVDCPNRPARGRSVAHSDTPALGAA